MLNPKLKPGDRVRLLYMEGESLKPNTWGTVKSSYSVFGSEDYSVVWDDGDKDNVGEKISQLNLISDTDAWDFGGRPKQIKESADNDMSTFIRNSDILKYFKINGKNTMSEVISYLKLIQKSGVVNMLESSPLLYSGSQWIERHYGDNPNKNDDVFEEVVERADEIKNLMITVTLELVQDKYKIDSEEFNNDEDEDDKNQDRVLQLMNSNIRNLSKKVIEVYIISF
jgi:hypothetical protein